MATILALGLGAAVYPQLLAVVVVILTRPAAKQLLWACYVGCLCTSVACAVAVLLVFRDRGGVIGSTRHHLGASSFLIVGAIAVSVAILLPTGLGQRLFVGGKRRLAPRRESRPRRTGVVERQKSRAQLALTRGSVPVAILVGAVLGIPGPLDLLALGRLATGGYSPIASIVLVVAFNLLKFLLIEIPIISYAIDPRGTAGRVGRFAAWMRAHQMKVIAIVVFVVGIVLVARGISRLG